MAPAPQILTSPFEGYTTDRQWLVYTPDAPWEGIDRIGVGTAASPSWVAPSNYVIAPGGELRVYKKITPCFACLHTNRHSTRM